MRGSLTWSAALAVLLTMGCGSDGPRRSPLTTLLAPSPQIPVPIVEPYWNFTTTLTSVTGPAVCSQNVTRVVPSTNGFLEVRRNGSAITLRYDVRDCPVDCLELTGSIQGDAFTAGTTRRRSWMCGSVRMDYDFDSRAAGRFSEDGQAIAARETWRYRYDSGETVELSFDWSAVRRSSQTSVRETVPDAVR
jgi:hypothetical protein